MFFSINRENIPFFAFLLEGSSAWNEVEGRLNNLDKKVFAVGSDENAFLSSFLTKLFEGSKRLFEIAESITEIKSICRCGSKATVNARIDANGRIITHGAQVFLGGNDSYIAMCHKCWIDRIREQEDQLTIF